MPRPNDINMEPKIIFIILSSLRDIFGNKYSNNIMNADKDNDDINDFFAKSKLIKIIPDINTTILSIRLIKPRFKLVKTFDITKAKPEIPPAAISWLNRKKYKPIEIKNEPSNIKGYFFIYFPPPLIVKSYHKLKIYSIFQIKKDVV